MEELRYLPSVITLGLFVIQIAAFAVIKFNDLRHLEKYTLRLDNDIKALSAKIDEQKTCSAEVAERTARIEGLLEAAVECKCKKPRKPKK